MKYQIDPTTYFWDTSTVT